MGRNGQPASCYHKKTSCKGLKCCSARSLPSSPLPPLNLDSSASAEKEIFFKTLGFYCTLADKGCAFDLQTDVEYLGSTALNDDNDLDPESSDSDSETDSEIGTKIIKDARRKPPPRTFCKGKLELRLNEYGRSFVQCEHRKKTDRAHLILRTLDEFDIPYLRALLENDRQAIEEREELARQFGYGPLVPCSFNAPPSAQKELCPYWHRESGKLARGVLERVRNNCTAKFDIYTPYDLFDCPRIVIICKNPHSHPNPHPVKTPPPLLEVFRSLLLDLDWKLADATPRKLMIDSGFMGGLRRALNWSKPFDPPLAALHPSLGNLDHVRRYIEELRDFLFPNGTGFEGAQLLAAQHRELPEDEQYVRCAETHTIEDGKTFQLVICMLRSMSTLLMRSKKLSLDTAFKRLNGKWQEFEMETIFEIAHGDTGVPCRFRHIHGEGFELWITDAHKGQALGAGMFCQKLCAELGDVYCPMEPTRLLRSLDPHEQLRRFLRFCTTHYKRNIDELAPYTTRKVRNAMLSLSSSQVHPDINAAFRIIEDGGRKAKAWLKDKRVGSKFALPALYQPMSLIPLEIWKSAPSTTNGNEQAHRNINRDGVNLTMLGGIMRGMQYDARAMGALELHSSQGIYSRDQTATHFRRLQRSLNRHVIVQTRVTARDALEREQAGGNATGSQASQVDEETLPGTAFPGPAAVSARATQQIPLFTTTPLAPSRNPPQDVPLTVSWLDKQVNVDISHMDGMLPRILADSTTFDFDYNASSSAMSSGYFDAQNVSQDTLDEYLTVYGPPVYPFDPSAFSTEFTDDNPPYLHVPQPYDLPSQPLPRAFTY
ncbi:hypothetical protein DFH09DRAFT_1293043 [Mycena vulgaris]|nr:hypothetical protein DFH09DRAFT_1293043 [Mycena vulgaris]